jgi:hypothetical protein
MPQPKPGPCWYFVDESGDPTFYGKGKGRHRPPPLLLGTEHCSPILILGFVEILEPAPIRASIIELQQTICADPYFNKSPYIERLAHAFHAKNDLPETRFLFFDLISKLPIRAEVIVARKIERLFLEKDGGKQHVFYDYLVTKLFECALERYSHNHICFASRGSKVRHQPMQAAIQQSATLYEQHRNIKRTTLVDLIAQRPGGEPCLSVIDYINWSVYQAYVHRDMRFFNKIRDKVSLVADIFDYENPGRRWYDRRDNPFDIAKTSPLDITKTTPLELDSETESRQIGRLSQPKERLLRS